MAPAVGEAEAENSMDCRVAVVCVIMISLSAQDPQVTDRPCDECHLPNAWYPLAAELSFDHDRDTPFLLTGGHLSAGCIQCHPGASPREIHQFDRAEAACVFCHMDIHLSQFGSDCEQCHETVTWDLSNWRYNHQATLFPLAGAHAALDCADCHGSELIWLRGHLTTDCVDCHENVYTNAVSTSGHPEVSECTICHNTRAWVPTEMVHHDRFFPIYSGAHRGEWTSCNTECHVDQSDYSVFSCGLNGVCHEHDRSEMDDKHDDEGGYVYESWACYNCHPSGEEDD